MHSIPTHLIALCPGNSLSFTPEKDIAGRSPRSWPGQTFLGECGLLVLLLLQLVSADIKITEINYAPPADGLTAGDAFQFIEIKNTGTAAVDLSGAAFVSGIGYNFPKTTSIGAGKFIVLVSVAASFAKRYPTVVPDGFFTKQLAKGGETIKLISAAGTALDSVTYSNNAPWPVSAAGSGFTLVPKNSNPVGNASDPAYWRASSKLYGSPGADDPAPTEIAGVVINEVLAHTDWPQVDAVELYNPTSAAVNIGGWYLTDNFDKPTRYRFPNSTIIPANGYIVVYSDNDTIETNNASLPPEFFGTGFALSCNGEEIYLFSADAAGNLTGYSDGFNYDASENGVSFGRYMASDGSVSYPSQTASTLGKINAGPRLGPIVISEIMYKPLKGHEFVELTNISANEVQLYDHERPANTWKTTNLSAFSFPPGITMKGGEVVLLVSDTIPPEDFRTLYTVPAAVKIYTFIGHIAASQTISIKKPLIPFVNDSGLTEIPYEVIDKVAYRSSTPWPVAANGTGSSLERIKPAAYGNDPANWRASTTTAGTPGSIVLAGIQPKRQRSVASRMQVTAIERTGLVTMRLFLASGSHATLHLVDLRGRTLDKTRIVSGYDQVHEVRLHTPAGYSGMVVCHLETSGGTRMSVSIFIHR
jgi:hypothetical protein